MKYVELFAGCGGFRLGLERAFPEAECVFANEWDKNAADVYDQQFGGKIDRRDITAVPTADIPNHDLLVGGFPCQAFSQAGKRGGFDDTRGTLFFEIARIAKERRPKYLLLENVRGLLSHDKGRTFKIILSALTELGYNTETMVLNSFYFGAAPRPRVFMFSVYGQYEIGVREGLEQALPLYASLREGLRLEDNTARVEESGRGSGRIIRTFAKLPPWLDGWEAIYGKEANNG